VTLNKSPPADREAGERALSLPDQSKKIFEADVDDACSISYTDFFEIIILK